MARKRKRRERERALAERLRVDPAEARRKVEAHVAAIVARHAERDRVTGDEEVRDG